MYKKASHRTGGKSLYGWLTSYTRPHEPESTGRDMDDKTRKEINKKFRGKRKPPSEQDLQRMIEEFERKKNEC